jgi:hypothetical protein
MSRPRKEKIMERSLGREELEEKLVCSDEQMVVFVRPEHTTQKDG